MADIAFIAYGRTLEGALENAAMAMLSIMFDMKKITAVRKPVKALTVKDTAGSAEDLVWFTLQDTLTKVQVGNLVPVGFSVNRLKTGKGLSISGVLEYKDVPAEDYGLLEVKAVTPSGLAVRKSKKGFSIRVVVDI
ncbi:MAG: archease [Candidatus Marsarchaeota archaeon]|nr:archease [Candidatus Marsarchaeota archaeon]